MSNTIISKIQGHIAENKLKAVPRENPDFPGQLHYPAAVWSYTYANGCTYLEHHYSAPERLNLTEDQILVSRDIDAYGINGLPEDVLNFINNSVIQVSL